MASDMTCASISQGFFLWLKHVIIEFKQPLSLVKGAVRAFAPVTILSSYLTSFCTCLQKAACHSDCIISCFSKFAVKAVHLYTAVPPLGCRIYPESEFQRKKSPM